MRYAHAAEVSSNFYESVYRVTLRCQHRNLCYARFCDNVHIHICDFMQRVNIKFCVEIRNAEKVEEIVSVRIVGWS